MKTNAAIRVVTLGLAGLLLTGAASYAQDLFSKSMTLQVDGNSRTHYYESSHDIDTFGSTIERLIVAVHGASRSNITFERIVDAAIANGVDDTTFVYAPQFVSDDDVADNNLGSEALFWPGGWRQGHLSTDNGFGRISSFALVNQVVSRILANNPGITDVVLVGHSAGGQYMQRFAATSTFEQDSTGSGSGIRVRYVPANPSSVVYMDNKRRVGSTTDVFAVPDSADCPEYDRYKYGLSGGFNNFVESIGGAAQVRAQYPGRDVRYFLGENDNDPTSSSLDTDCEAILQGSQRLERGIVFYKHVRDHFGESVHDTHVLAISPGVGHTSSIYTTECGISWLFDIGDCPFVVPTHLQVSVDTATGVASLDWRDRASGEENYEVERSVDGGTTFNLLGTIAADAVNYVDTTALASTEYRYRVRTQSKGSTSAYSNVAVANAGGVLPIDPPPAPSSGGSVDLILLLALVTLVALSLT